MAMQHGTANTQADLYNSLIAFLTTNGDLVAAGQAWEVAWTVDAETHVLRGPGLSDQDQVYIGMQMRSQPDQDSYWLDFWGMVGVLSTATLMSEHVVVKPTQSRIFADTQPVEYWFVANGRRFIVVLKISTVFQAAYCGLFLPYANPLSYPYPLFVGASAQPWQNSGYSSRNWRSTAGGFRNFWTPNYVATGGNASETTSWLMNPQGDWVRVSVGNDGADFLLSPNLGWAGDSIVRPGTENEFSYPEEYFTFARLMAAYGEEYPLIPVTLAQRVPTGQTMGILDGVFRCQTYDNASQNIITKDGVDYLVVQNTFRTGLGEYAAIILE